MWRLIHLLLTVLVTLIPGVSLQLSVGCDWVEIVTQGEELATESALETTHGAAGVLRHRQRRMRSVRSLAVSGPGECRVALVGWPASAAAGHRLNNGHSAPLLC